MPTRCKCAHACQKALDDASLRWSKRNRASDGCCGDAAHAKRQSDHNPDASGYAHAFDLTHDPLNGPNCNELALQVIHDPRVKYVIWNSRIFKVRTGKWEIYRGSNPHNKHMHVSIKPEARNDLSPWPWSVEAVVRRGDRGAQVREIQLALRIKADGIFGKQTEAAVKQFQKEAGLDADGVVGVYTRRALEELS